MKKLLLASTALFVMGGAAYAQDISFSATIGAEFGNWDDGDGSTGDGTGLGGAANNWDWKAELKATMEGSSNGLSYGGSVTADADGGDVDFGEMWVSGGWGRLGFDENDYDEIGWDKVTGDLDTTDTAYVASGTTVLTGEGETDAGDVKYEGSFGDVDVVAVLDFDNTNYHFVSADYSGNGFSAGVESVNDLDDSNLVTVSASADVGNFTIGGEAASDDSWEVFASTSFNDINAKVTLEDDDTVTVNLDGSAGAVDWALEVDSDSEYEASLSTSFGDTSVDVEYDSNANYFSGNEYDSDDAVAMIMISHSVGNIEVYGMANDNSDAEVGFKSTFDF